MPVFVFIYMHVYDVMYAYIYSDIIDFMFSSPYRDLALQQNQRQNADMPIQWILYVSTKLILVNILEMKTL